jgi:two-component sensor histidine kinase
MLSRVVNRGQLKSVLNKTITIIVQDDGIGFQENNDNESSSGFGIELIKMLTKQLNGTIKFEQNNGTIVTLIFDQKF